MPLGAVNQRAMVTPEATCKVPKPKSEIPNKVPASRAVIFPVRDATFVRYAFPELFRGITLRQPREMTHGDITRHI